MREKGFWSLLAGPGGCVKLTLLGTIVFFFLTLGFLLALNMPVQAFVTKAASCSSSSCHGTANPSATLTVGINGTQRTSLSVTAGTTFEIDWIYTNMLYNVSKYSGTSPEIALPTGWTIAVGTANSTGLTGWNTVWNATGGSSWNTSYSSSGEFPNSPDGYSVDYTGTAWDNGSRNAATDDATAGKDLDGVANKMGADARITVPVATPPGTYTIMLLGVGHDSGNNKAHVEQAVTITVQGGSTPQNPAVSVTGPSSITYPNTGQITYTGGQGTGAMSYSHGSSTGCTVNSSTGLITMTNASGTCSVTATKAGDATYLPSTSSAYPVTLVKATPTISVTNSPVTYDGSAKAATVTGSVAGTASSIQYNGSSTVPTSANTYAITANFTPTDSNNYSSLTGASAGNFIINKAAASASVTNSPVTYDGTAKSALVSCQGGGASSNILTGGTATKTNAGTYAVTADCATSTNYLAGTGLAAGNFVIDKATPTVSVTNSPVTYDGSAKAANVTGSVAGTASNVLTGGAANQTNAGTYAVTANFAPTDSTNYNSLTGASAGDFIINKATPTASVTNSPVTYDGSAKSATVACLGGGTPGNILTGGAPSQTNAGTYAVTTNCAASTNYNAATAVSAGNFTINKATPNLSVTNSPVTYDSSAKAANVTGSVAGTVSNILTGGAATQANAGTYAVTADFAPTDSTNYNSLTGASAGDFIINKATPTASVTNSPVTYDGSAKSATVACLGGGTPGNIVTGGAATQINAGTYGVTTDCAASTNYNAATGIAAGNFIINKADQAAVSVTASDSAYYNQVGLTAVASGGNGTGAYSYSAGASTACTVDSSTGALTITAGTGTCSITATRAADSNYNVSAASSPATVIIGKATPSVTAWPTASAITEGQTLASSTLTGGTASVSGSFAFTNPSTAPAVGTAPQSVTFTPADTGNYQTVVGTVDVTVNASTSTATLSVTIAGTGGGTVNDGSTLTCSNGTCTADYTLNASVTLMATPSGNAVFTGWSGACTGTGDCVLTMDGPKSVTATFNNPPLIKIGEGTYTTVVDAYAAIQEGQTMQLTERTFAEDLIFNRLVTIILEGGLSDDFQNTIGSTIIDGSLTISNGAVTIKSIVIQ